jgi:hypothetical protein
MTMTVNRTDCSPNVGADLRVRPSGGCVVIIMHTGTNCGPGMDGWMAGRRGSLPLHQKGDTIPDCVRARSAWCPRKGKGGG